MVNLQDYIIDSNIFKTFSLDDLLFVQYKCLIEDDESEIWTHHNYFAYAFGGQKKWKTRNGEYLISSGESIFVKKSATAVHQYFEESFLVLFIFIPDSYIQQILSKYPELLNVISTANEHSDSVIPLSLNEVLTTFFQSLYSYFLQPNAPPKSILKLKMEELILNIISQPKNNLLKHYFHSIGRRQKIDLEEIMKTHYFYPLSIKDYARLCARSLSSFRRDFYEVFHTTPAKWLLDQRMTYGKFLLETSDKSINEVVDESGFKNRSHFMKLFKQTYGISPKQFQLNRKLKRL